MESFADLIKDWSGGNHSFFFGGIFAARQVIKAGPKTKAVLDGILTLPMVLPPTVAGFFFY